MRTCTKCNESKLDSSFYAKRGKCRSQCKDCDRAYAFSKRLFVEVESLDGEIWKDVVGYEGFYQVSNLGRLKSIPRTVSGGRHGANKFLAGKLIDRSKINTDYDLALICKDGVRKTIGIHRLVAIAFIPNPENKPQINHKDGNGKNNKLENLEWCTARENSIHAHETGLQPHAVGVQRGRVCKLTDTQVRDIKRRIQSGTKLKDIASEFGVNPVTISDIKREATWAHV